MDDCDKQIDDVAEEQVAGVAMIRCWDYNQERTRENQRILFSQRLLYAISLQ